MTIVDELALMLPTPAEPPNGTYKVIERDRFGKQLLASYPNGYGASVISGPYTYGGPEGKYELAVTHDIEGKADLDAGERGDLCYATSLTGDVIGWLDPTRVVELLHQIAALPSEDTCSHNRPDDWNPFDNDDEGAAGVGDMLDSLLGRLSGGVTP